ncbi:hypothetical protein F5148DRAFT_974552 [Russula earlei]|uniref:Uncharacterized protein n=1 Tax=Russula earlei TaxID=71964 RepID=A0ACC0UJQ5_9AGAM|nr:hypothetical protein F5148DRAFT_974552 [Russula earlei]
MVHRPSDSRLLSSLLSNEKEYHNQLLVLLDNHSQLSLGALAAYASASPAPVARAIIAVAASLAGADDALRNYAASIKAWQAELRALKDLEEDVGNVIRDREIFVTRLIKLSKNQKPTRDSFIGTLGASVGESSQTSLNSFTSPSPSSSKLGAAQAELQACEVHLAAKERELDELRVSAVRRGLEVRCKAMVECGWNWGEMGKEGLRALEGIETPPPNGLDASSHKLLSDLDRPPGSDLSSIGPSQSASQIYIPLSTPPRVASPGPVSSRPSSPRPPMPSSSSVSVTLQIPPAHSISELALPSTLKTRLSEVPEDLEHTSSDEDTRPVEVVENARFATATTNPNIARRLSIRPPSRDKSNNTGTGSFSQSASSTVAPPHHSVSVTARDRERKGSGKFLSSIAGLFRGGSTSSSHSFRTEKWKTRTETNLRAVRRDEDSDSEHEGPTGSPSRRFFNRRVSHDSPRPQSPATPQKLKKRIAQEMEKDEGWISDGAAVRGRGARKGSARKRSALSDTSRPVPPPVPKSALSRSTSAVSTSPSHVSAPASTTPSRPTSGAKPKTVLRIETLARSSSTEVSRQSSLRVSGSAPPPRRPDDAGEHATGLPSSRPTLGASVGRSDSLVHHRKTKSLTHASAPPPPPHADAGRAGSGQMSLMALVEGVTRDNRAAWDRANAGLPSVSADGNTTVGGLLTVRAPPPITEYNLRGEGGRGIAFESVLAPGSVLATPSRAASSTPQRPSSLPPPARMSMPVTPPGKAPKIPLRSALRNYSPPPAPPPKPIVIPSAPPRVVVASESTAQARNGKDRGDDEGSDSGSVASFRTVREMPEEELAAPAPAAVPAPPPSSSTLAVPGQDESDVSTSTISANGGPTRRKSVRVSLQPTFSPTPPALDEDEDETWERGGRPAPLRSSSGTRGGRAVNGRKRHDDGSDDVVDGEASWRGRNGRDRDLWADSSDEDEEYAKARKLLTRASKKRW